MQLPFARRAGKVVYLPQSLPAGVHLQVLESVIVAQRASGGRAHQADEEAVMVLLTRLGIAIWRCNIWTISPAARSN